MTGIAPVRADALVMFGLTGDLGESNLFPALAELSVADRLNGPVVGVGRRAYSHSELEQMFLDASGIEQNDRAQRFDLRYVQGDSQDATTYEDIAEAIDGAEQPVVYLALPPELFSSIARLVSESRLPDTTRLVFEKPFGDGVASARRLFEEITDFIPADQVFMVDHFLSKNVVENLLALRKYNPMLEASMRSGVVERVEFTMAEDFDVAGRGGFYDDVGAVKDVLQNHILQTIAVLMMEPPTTSATDDFDSARANLIGAIRPMDPAKVVLGQYRGYHDAEGVAEDSTTETFVACALEVDTPRWNGVEVMVRCGKALRETYTEAVLVFSDGSKDIPPNRVRFLLKPQQRVVFEIAVLGTEGEAGNHRVEAHRLSTEMPGGHGALSDYATMLDSAMAGDQRHFARIDDTLAAWGVVEPVVESPPTPVLYERGSMGPEEADALPAARHWIESSHSSG